MHRELWIKTIVIVGVTLWLRLGVDRLGLDGLIGSVVTFASRGTGSRCADADGGEMCHSMKSQKISCTTIEGVNGGERRGG